MPGDEENTMKNKFTIWLLAAGLAPAVLLTGCSRRDEATIGTPANPLVVVISPAHTPAGSTQALDFIKKSLGAATAMTVEIKTAKTPAETIKLFDMGKADAGLVTLEEYLVAREEYGVHAPLQALRGAGLTEYDAAILTRAKDGITDVKELAGKKFGVTGPYSFSGFTLPCIYLAKAGIKPERVVSASHNENIARLLKGDFPAAASFAGQALHHAGLKVLAITGRVPNEPLVVRRSLAADKRTLLVSAFLALGNTAEGRKALGALADITGFRPVDEDVYKPVHDLLLKEGRSVYDLVPDGWEIQRLNQPYMPD